MPDPYRSAPAFARAMNLTSGHLPTMAFMGLVAGAVPMPLLPSAALRRLRGALVHDVAARHGLTLTPDARKALSEPSRTAQGGAVLATLAYAARRTLGRFGMLGLLPPVAAWIEIYALGLLFERYLDRFRSSQALRIHAAEAKKVRGAIDRAVGRAVSPRLALGLAHAATPAEEMRGLSTRLVDGLLLAAAALPGRLTRRLEAAFDRLHDEEQPGAG